MSNDRILYTLKYVKLYSPHFVTLYQLKGPGIEMNGLKDETLSARVNRLSDGRELTVSPSSRKARVH